MRVLHRMKDVQHACMNTFVRTFVYERLKTNSGRVVKLVLLLFFFFAFEDSAEREAKRRRSREREREREKREKREKRASHSAEYNGYRIIARAHPRATNRLEITSARSRSQSILNALVLVPPSIIP